MNKIIHGFKLGELKIISAGRGKGKSMGSAGYFNSGFEVVVFGQYDDYVFKKRNKKYWESEIPNTEEWNKSFSGNIAELKKDSGRVVFIENWSRREEVLNWMKENKIGKINHYLHNGGLVITFIKPEDAVLCQLTWGGDIC